MKGRMIHEVARDFGVSVRMLQHYDRQGLLCPRRTENGYREYGEGDLARLGQILRYRKAGFTLKETRQILDEPSCDVAAVLRAQLTKLRCEEAELLEKMRYVEALLTDMETSC